MAMTIEAKILADEERAQGAREMQRKDIEAERSVIGAGAAQIGETSMATPSVWPFSTVRDFKKERRTPTRTTSMH